MCPTIFVKISVCWPEDKEFYSGTEQSKSDQGMCNIQYDDVDGECLNMKTDN